MTVNEIEFDLDSQPSRHADEHRVHRIASPSLQIVVRGLGSAPCQISQQLPAGKRAEPVARLGQIEPVGGRRKVFEDHDPDIVWD